MGLAIAVQAPDDFVVFRWRGPRGRAEAASGVFDRLELVQVQDGRETVLAERPARYRPHEFYRLSAAWSGRTVVCFVDGNEVLRAELKDVLRGQVGLYALEGDPVFFDDVHVASDRSVLEATRRPERRINDIFASEADMQGWANPAQEWRRDIVTGWAEHNSRFPGEQAVILRAPRYKELEIALFAPQDEPARAGLTLRLKGGQAELAGPGWSTQRLNVDQAPARIAFRAHNTSAEVQIGGQVLRSTRAAGGAELGRAPLDRVAIRGLSNLGDPQTVRVTSSNTLEYTFDTSPTDWKVAAGRWGLLNKWICDPRWSWFGGRTRALAVLWNKQVFEGDLSVEAHVALMMQKDDPPYERPGDYNLTICGDGVNLDSGYTLIYGGDDNAWTRLYRKGQLVAESQKEEHRVFSDRIRHPDKPQLHQRWFHLKLEKTGNTVSFYRDNVLAFSYVDPEPLPDGRVAFWTLDNGFLLARVRLAHNGLRPAPFESDGAELFDDGRVVNLFDGETVTAVKPLALPEPIRASLNSPKATFQSADAEFGMNAPQPDKPAEAYRVTNAHGGGPFALQWRNMLVDPEIRGFVRFAYCLPPGTSVDLYLVEAGTGDFNPRHQNAFRWRMTGPRESTEFAPLVGDVPGVVADGRWHTVQFNLQPSWAKFWRERGYPRPRRLNLRPFIGNIDNTGYLLAGMNANRAEAWYGISGLIAWQPHEVDRQPPAVERVIWPFDADGDATSLTVLFQDPGGSGVAEESLQLSLNRIAVPRHLLSFDAQNQRLRVDLQALNLPAFTAETTLDLSLLALQDRAGNLTNTTFQSQWRFDPAKVAKDRKIAAPVIRIKQDNGEVDDGLPLSPALVDAVEPMARVESSTSAPPWAPLGQQRSLRVANFRDGSAFGFTLRTNGLDLRRWPYLLLDYRIPFETPTNLHVYSEQGLHALLLTDVGDVDDPLSQRIDTHFGPPDDFVADDTWRRSIVPWYALFRRTSLDTPSLRIMALSMEDHGWRGNRRGMQYWVHQMRPLAAGRPESLSFTWSSSDLSGSADFAAVIDAQPTTEPAPGQKAIEPGKLLAEAKDPAALRHGWNYLHVRVQNGAGLWSETAHVPFFLDLEAPTVTATEPAAGKTWASQRLSFTLKEDHAIFLSTLRLTINGQRVAGQSAFNYDLATRTLTFDSATAGTRWPDGAVEVELDGLQDIYGNRAGAPFKLSFVADSKADQTGPPAPRLRFASRHERPENNRQIDMEISMALDFEQHTGHVLPQRDCTMTWLDNPARSHSGRRAVEFTIQDHDADAQIMLHKNPWYIDRLPTLQFDYLAEPGVAVDVMVEVLGEWQTIHFTGTGTAPRDGKAIGVVSDAAADGQWRHASIDLRKVVLAANPNLPVRIINKVILSAHGEPGCRRGAKLILDNVQLVRPAGGGGEFEWEAPADPNGVQGYWFELSPEPLKTLGTTISHRPEITRAPLDHQRGVWYAHLRAVDALGNWGPVRVMRIDFGE